MNILNHFATAAIGVVSLMGLSHQAHAQDTKSQSPSHEPVGAAEFIIFGSSSSPEVKSRMGWRNNLFARKSNTGGDDYLFHNGDDLAIPNGTPMYARYDSVVLAANENCGKAGRLMYLAIPNQCLIVGSFHHQENNYSAGQPVPAGKPFALSGDTGRVTGPHAHIETIVYGYTMTGDPMTFAIAPQIADRIVSAGGDFCNKETVDGAVAETASATKTLPIALRRPTVMILTASPTAEAFERAIGYKKVISSTQQQVPQTLIPIRPTNHLLPR